jgi:hypothetical protein
MATNVKISQLPTTVRIEPEDLLVIAGTRNGNALTTYSLSAGDFYLYQHGSGFCSIQPVDGYNTASGVYSSVTSGLSNFAACNNSIVAGGAYNRATFFEAAIVGGRSNTAYGNASFIGGGEYNIACGGWSTIAGGFSNETCRSWSTVIGGYCNNAFGNYSGVLGGFRSRALSDYSSVVSGRCNTASGLYSSIIGGQNNLTNFNNTFIIGSNLSASRANFTYVNNISSQGTVNAASIKLNDNTYPLSGLTNTTMGSSTFTTNASAVVLTSAVTNNSRIFITVQEPYGSVGTPFITSRTATTSFTVSSTNIDDRSGFAWLIIEPA